ncbi:phage holin family protein [Hymenobacter taeanensis]|uniref:Phage holin family protein n=1 Tax=Hymenobacter taeanensis TaxID=2735321 RepID=A0A6M6BK15_9BACT|nr:MULTISPECIES: phage holin family protein [Hymenobacter]QJX48309.1 phage holin family protein [Hymenobacter taeanensis]UOQ82199.1 phage holin family protein [Hymenobacter sp. 5414T-23]
MGFILKFLLSAIITYVLAKFLPGSHIGGFSDAIILVIVLAILNAVVKPILKIIGFPITILTLGLFLLVINALIVMMASYLLTGFEVDGFVSALIFSVVLSLVTAVIDLIFD